MKGRSTTNCDAERDGSSRAVLVFMPLEESAVGEEGDEGDSAPSGVVLVGQLVDADGGVTVPLTTPRLIGGGETSLSESTAPFRLACKNDYVTGAREVSAFLPCSGT
ncbi:hypothetical protein MRX96_032577 [Rhipicephalus microplus]